MNVFSKIDKIINSNLLKDLKESLKYLSIPCNSMGKCSRITRLIGHIFKRNGYKNVKFVWVDYNGYSHAILKVGNWAIDFTLSQFDESKPFPFISKINSKEFKEMYVIEKIEELPNLIKEEEEDLKKIKISKLVQKYREEKDRKEWALVSQDGSRVLEWYGTKKPSKEKILETERRVQYFKHK